MIKELITDLAHDKITLAQAITRAKIISSKVANIDFRAWLTKELGGYEHNDANLPEYRKIRCVIYLTAEFMFGKIQSFPISLDDVSNVDFQEILKYYRATAPISILEKNIESLTTNTGQIPLLPEQVELLGGWYRDSLNSQGGVIRSGYWQVGKIQFINIIEQTKQKLLDTLLDLDMEFPNLTNDFAMSTENLQKVQNIITNNIYGHNSPTNIATGVNVEQNITYNYLSKEDNAKLAGYGVTDAEIEDLKTIIATKGSDKPTFVGKAMKWLGSVTASVAGKGLYEHIPAITDFIHKLTS